MNVFELFATLSLDSSQYDEALDNSEKKGSNFASKLGSGMKTAGKVAAGALTAATAATVAGGKAFADGVKDVANYGDHIDKTSQKLGLSTTAFQEWDYVLTLSGTSMDNMATGMKTLTNKLDDAKNGSADAQEMFAKLGLSMDDLRGMSREDIFAEVIYGFQDMAESTERAALANDLFGKSGQELTPLFNQSAQATQLQIAAAHEYGMVLSEEAVASSAGFVDSLTTLQNTMGGLKNNMLSQFLPSVTKTMDGLARVFSGHGSGGLKNIEEGVAGIASKMSEQAPRLVQVGGTIISALVTAISSNLPALLSSGLEAVRTIGQGILQNLPSILDAAISLISEIAYGLIDAAPMLLDTALTLVLELATGLGNAAPQLIPAVVDMVMVLIDKLTQPNTIGLLINAAIVLIGGIATGIIKAIPSIVKTIPTLVKNLVTSLVQNFPLLISSFLGLLADLFQAGLEAINDFMGVSWDDIGKGLSKIKEGITAAFDAIKGFFSNLWTNCKEIVSKMWDNIKEFFGNGLDGAKEKVSNGLSAIVGFFTDKFDRAKEIVKNAIEAIKNFFKFDWKLPDLKLPHFKLQGEFSLSPPSVPKIGVDWYKKAYSDAYLLNGATIFGAAGGRLLGGGEGAGSEAIIGTDLLRRLIREESGAGLPSQMVFPIYIGNDKIDEKVINAQQIYDFISGGRG